MFPIFLFRWRLLRPALLLLLFLTLSALFYIYHTFKPPIHLYNSLFDAEVQSSRNIAAQSKQPNTLRYVKFRQLQGAGFNNQVRVFVLQKFFLTHPTMLQAQEILLYHHLALETSRIYVYQPLIWRPRGEKAAVPLSAFLLGATEGSITEAVFDEVCPPHEVHHVNLRIDQVEQWFHAKDVLNRTDRCVVVDDWIFNWTCVWYIDVIAKPYTNANETPKLSFLSWTSRSMAIVSAISRNPLQMVGPCTNYRQTYRSKTLPQVTLERIANRGSLYDYPPPTRRL